MVSEQFINPESEHFKPYEFACRGRGCCGGVSAAVPELVESLEAMRLLLCTHFGKTMPIFPTSGFRCNAHNAAIGGGIYHPKAMAVDFIVPGVTAQELEGILLHTERLTDPRFTNLLIRGWGRDDYRNYVHVDVRPVAAHVVRYPVKWCYGRDGRPVEYYVS